jgi:hypothetical protein
MDVDASPNQGPTKVADGKEEDDAGSGWMLMLRQIRARQKSFFYSSEYE